MSHAHAALRRTVVVLFLLAASAVGAAELEPGLVEAYDAWAGAMHPAELETGSCVAHAEAIYRLLERHGAAAERLRVVLMVREPDHGMPQPMRPDNDWIRGEPVSFWIWHAVTTLDGRVFDPKYRTTGETLERYFATMWSKDGSLADFWIFSVPAAEIKNIAGSTYPGGPPRMLQFEPIDYRALVAHPLHTTRRKAR